MVPLKLTLRNFMCYRDGLEPLDLSGVQVACLSGDNGAGKSALLDAITWALWGRARAKNDDELVHLAETEMEVELEFLAGETQYRVIRKRARAGAGHRTGHSILELQILDEGLDGAPAYRPISGNAIRDTQTSLSKILHLDYDTFINSAYLVQGRADEFTLKSPGDRKAVLGKLLDLEQYDTLDEKARERVRVLSASITAIETENRRKGQELAYKERAQEALYKTQSQRQELERGRTALESRVALLKESKSLVEAKKAQLTETRRTREEAEQEIAASDRRKKEAEKRAAEYRATIAEADAILAGTAELESIRKRHTALSRSASQWAGLTQKKNQLESSINQSRAQLIGEITGLQRQKDGLHKEANAVAEKTRLLTDARSLLEAIEQEEPRLAQSRLESEAASANVLRLTNEQERAAREGQELRQKLEIFTLSGADAQCPICGSDLGAGGLANLKQHYDAEIMDKRNNYKQVGIGLKSALEEENSTKAAADKLEKYLVRERSDRQVRVGTLQREVETAEEADARLNEVLAGLTSMETKLENQDFARGEQRELTSVLASLASLQYDPDALELLRQSLESLQIYETKRQMLDNAIAQAPREEEELASTGESINRWTERRDKASQTESLLSEELAGANNVLNELAQAESELDKTMSGIARLRDDEAKLQGQLEYYRHLESELKRDAAYLQKLGKEQELYKQLTDAFGKRGVQALIIEQVLPELEEETNQLLSRMT
ncbi:MAG: SMC family ATPase, partial [Dehalococcoidia bacterium]|nr:SMC family ATPase [Dehalococcoidia bacterium]